MTTIAYRIVKLESVFKKTKVKNDTFFAVVTFSKINSFAYISSVIIRIYNI